MEISAGAFGEASFVLHVYGLEGDGWDVDEVDVTVQATVEAEVAEVGGDAVEVAGVVAQDGDGDACGLLLRPGLGSWIRGGCGVVEKRREKVGDVEDELVVAADVLAGECFTDVGSGRLACALEVKKGTAAFIWIGYGNVGAVPAVATVVGDVRVAAVVCVEAMRHRYGLPCGDLFAVPGLPRAAE